MTLFEFYGYPSHAYDPLCSTEETYISSRESNLTIDDGIGAQFCCLFF